MEQGPALGCGRGNEAIAWGFPGLGIGFLGVALAFGLTVLTMAYAFGYVSGAHLNPAVSVGLWIGGRLPIRDLVPYVIAQLLGAIAGAAVLYVIASGAPMFNLGGFASNGFGSRSPGGYSLGAALLTEAVMTFFFLLVILGSPAARVRPSLPAARRSGSCGCSGWRPLSVRRSRDLSIG